MAVKVRRHKHFFSDNILYPISEVVFRQRPSTIKGLLPSKFLFGQRSSSVKGGPMEVEQTYPRNGGSQEGILSHSSIPFLFLLNYPSPLSK